MPDSQQPAPATPGRDLAALAEILRTAAAKPGYTVVRICHEAKINRGTWYRILKQEVARPSIPTLTNLAHVLNLDAARLHQLAGHQAVPPSRTKPSRRTRR